MNINGWISPKGYFYRCDFGEHDKTIREIANRNAAVAIMQGFIQIITWGEECCVYHKTAHFTSGQIDWFLKNKNEFDKYTWENDIEYFFK